MHHIRKFSGSAEVQAALNSGDYEQVYVAYLTGSREFDYNTLRRQCGMKGQESGSAVVPDPQSKFDGGGAEWTGDFDKRCNGSIADLDNIDSVEYEQ